MSDCGPTSESCCVTLEVSGGTFERTYDLAPDGGIVLGADGGPTAGSNKATVSSFVLDKYLVTVGRFRRFVTAWNNGAGLDGGAGYLPQAGSGRHVYLNGGQGLVNGGTAGGYESGWLASYDVNVAPTNGNLACSATFATWTTTPGVREPLPINCVNWYEAYAFCIWDGGVLPSEAEWEFAAAGGADQREFPWGSAAPGSMNQYAIYGCYYNTGSLGSCSSSANIAPVGAAPLGAGRWGQLDLAGELNEWTLDWDGSYAVPCNDCMLQTNASSRFTAGGYFKGPGESLVPPHVGASNASGRAYYNGFRCARAP